MDFADCVKVLEAEQHLAHRDGDLRFREGGGFQLFRTSMSTTTKVQQSDLTRSLMLPARNSMMIQSLYPLTKLPKYRVMWGESQA